MTNTLPNSVSQPHYSLARWALIAGILVGGILAGASLEEALRLHAPTYLLGCLPAAVILAGLFLLGLRPWSAWSKVTGAVLMFISSGWFTLTAYWLATGRGYWVSSDYVTAAGMGMAASVVAALLFLASGWVYRDARRRGLNGAVWATITVVIFPYLIGFIAYLIVVVLRDRQVAVCAGCGCRLPPNAAFCIRCGRQVHATCPQCKSPVISGATFCGHCGATVTAA